MSAPAPRTAPPLARRAFGEALGTGLLVAVVVGSGVAAERLSPGDTGVQLLENALATAAGLAIAILVVAPVSGAHLNPAITVVARLQGALTGRDAAAYVAAQVAGGAGGAVLANLLYDLPAAAWSGTAHTGAHLWLSEVVATAGLVLVVVALARTGRQALAPVAVAAYIGGAYFFTSSTSFANPAVTAARSLTDTFTGISPGSVPPFVVAQLAGALVGLGAARLLYPQPAPVPETIDA